MWCRCQTSIYITLYIFEYIYKKIYKNIVLIWWEVRNGETGEVKPRPAKLLSLSEP